MADSQASQSLTKVWIVTGCSSGFGRHLVSAILSRGDMVVATARRMSDLDYISNLMGGKERALRLVLDVTESTEQICGKIDMAIAHFGTVDVLVNNAGFVVSGVWEEVSHEETMRQFNTNFFGALNVTRCVLPHLRKSRSGVILFMGSISGWYGVAAGGPYSASKFALEGAAECLSKETTHLGIRTHILVLGQFRTAILDDSRKVGILDPNTISDYDHIKDEMSARHKETHGKQPGDAELAAARIVDIVKLENLGKQEGKDLPLRIPLGSDALQTMRLKCRQTLDNVQDWEEFAASTNFAGASLIPSYLR